VFKDLDTTSSYKITKVSFEKSGSHGTVTRWITFSRSDPFSPVYNSVLNLGELKCVWYENGIDTQFLGNVMVKNYFTKEASDSEWLTKPLINQYQ